MSVRQSNIELLRIVSIIMVLVLHANFLALGPPFCEGFSLLGMARTFIQSVCIVAVNVFVMISGWFGLQRSWKGYFNLAWQIAYIVGLALLLGAFILNEPLTVKDLFMPFGLFYGGGWFVSAYIGLYILSPVLNAYINSCSTMSLGVTVGLFIVFQTIFGDTMSAAFIVMGYSTFSFIGLYLLSAWLRRISSKVTRHLCAIIFSVCCVVDAILYIVTSIWNVSGLNSMVFNYINPVVIIQSAAILLYFSKLDILSLSKRINLLAKSSFTVYLLHTCTPFMIKLYISGVKAIVATFSGVWWIILIISGYILAIYLLAFVIDTPRRYIWDCLSKKFNA